jgi:subtilisin family serine protease
MRWLDREASLITYAHKGRAVIAKAAGNDGVAVGSRTAEGSQDYLNAALIGSPSAIFVGALERNGTVSDPAPLARYSNIAGGSAEVQNQFLVVGVEGDKTGLYGTSYAAPIVSGYAAILGSKFTRASPTQIAKQLLSTARSDTVAAYDAAVHGQGEASIARALAPRTIE